MIANPDATSQIMGEVMFAAGLAQMLCLTLAIKNPDWRPNIESGLDQLLFQWEGIAADPEHPIPGALAHCRRRAEEFLAEFRELTRSAAAGNGTDPNSGH